MFQFIIGKFKNLTAVFFTASLLAIAACGGGGMEVADTPPNTNPPAGAGQTGQIEIQNGIPSTGNSIAAKLGGGRSDPENVAAPVDNTSNVTWKDSNNADRTLVLGGYLYQYDFSFLGGVAADPTQATQRSVNDDAFGHEGFGYLVSHNDLNGNSPLGKANTPSKIQTTVLAGGHHSIHRVELFYDRDKEAGGEGIKIPVVIEWLVATGRDHPLWAVNWQVGKAVNPNNIDFNTYRMDIRGPYGSLNFDGAATRAQGDAIGGVAWGDFALKFSTTNQPLTLNSTWTYNTANSVNFTQAWTANVNAEMGIVQTKAGDKEMGYADRVVGRERGSSSAAAYPEKGNCNGFGDARNYSVPCVNGWPYQLMNYDWDPGAGKNPNEATGTKLLAWGSPYGWLGSSSFDVFDYSAKADGRGDRSYATFIVLGPKCRFNAGACNQEGDVAITLKAVEALAAATISNITQGTLVTQIAKGPGATELKNLSNGYNDTYGAHYLKADNNGVGFTFTPAAGKPVKNPVFVIQNYTAGKLPTITVDGAARTVNSGDANSGAFVSLNTTTNELWVTLNENIAAPATIQISN